MKTRTRFNDSRTPRRGAFTLIELMVVTAIIAALAALTAGAVMKFVEVQQRNNTQSTLDRTQGQLAKAWSRVKHQAYTETIPSSVDTWIRGNVAGSDANAAGRVRIIYVKLKLRQAFPMNFTEVLTQSGPIPPLQVYSTYLTKLGVNPATIPYQYQSSACLLMALQRGVSGAGLNPEELTKGGAAGNYNGLPYLADAWGRPIFFARFPTGCPLLNPNSLPQIGANDPGDPQGLLNDGTWAKLMPQGQQLFSALTLQQLAPPSSPPLSYKLAPMVASGGPLNWEKPRIPWAGLSAGNYLTFHPTTFQPGAYDLATGTFTQSAGNVTGVMYSNTP